MNLNLLYKRASDGDPASEKELFQLLTVRLRSIVQLNIWNKDDAEEIVQDTLMTIVHKYRDIEIHSSFSGWVSKIVDNKILNYLRTKRYRQARFTQTEQTCERPYKPDPELRLRILDCLKKICRANVRNARMLNLYYQGYDTDQICRRLSITRNNAYSILFRARAMLELCLKKGDIR